jgi:ABC-type amino acid transport substrate-binding protein
MFGYMYRLKIHCILFFAIYIIFIAVAILVWGIDNIYFSYLTAPSRGRDSLDVTTPAEAEAEASLAYQHKFERYWWESIMRPMMNRDLAAFTVAGNIIYVVFGFLLLILYTLYLGNTAANLTLLRIETGGITGVETLRGNAVGTWSDYSDKLQKYGIAPAEYPWDTAADEEAMFDALKTGSVKALVLDTPLMEYIAATDCEVSVVGSSFEAFEQAVAFPKGFNNTALLNRYNEVLVILSDSGEDEQLAATYITPPPSECGELYSAKVTLKQVAGLWILLGVCTGMSLAWLAITKLWESRVNARRQARQGNSEAVKESISNK